MLFSPFSAACNCAASPLNYTASLARLFLLLFLLSYPSVSQEIINPINRVCAGRFAVSRFVPGDYTLCAFSRLFVTQVNAYGSTNQPIHLIRLRYTDHLVNVQHAGKGNLPTTSYMKLETSERVL